MQATAKLPIMLKQLKLPTINQNWEPMVEEATEGNWSYDEYLAHSR